MGLYFCTFNFPHGKPTELKSTAYLKPYKPQFEIYHSIEVLNNVVSLEVELIVTYDGDIRQ